jgi:uncharacterized protein YceH (UPF0502 family)
MMDDQPSQAVFDSDGSPPVRELTAGQRRVLGTLVEKAITTPNQYPLTLKALASGCNQTSNRDPVSNYSEESISQIVDELRQLGLAATVHTEGGRTERVRHYVRKRFPFTEPQLAIMTELLLRGRQQLGELRARSSRLAPLESLDDLRRELKGLADRDYVHATGPLDRRGVEVDHNLYLPVEARRQNARAASETESAGADDAPEVPEAAPAGHRAPQLVGTMETLRADYARLAADVDALKDVVARMQDELVALRRELGG